MLEVGGIRFRVDATQANKSLNDFRKQLNEVGIAATMTQKQIDQLKRGFVGRAETKTFEDVIKGSNISGMALAQLQLQAGQTREAFKTLGLSLSNFMSGMLSFRSMLAGLGIGLIAKDLLQTGAQFDHFMRTVGAVTEATTGELGAMTNAALNMGETTMYNATQAAEAMKFLGQAGFSAMQAIKALPGVIDLATASNFDLGKASDIAVHALNAMELQVEQLGRVNDVFITGANKTSTDIDQLSEAFKYGAPIAHAYGYSIEELTGMIGILSNAGIQGSMAGMQLAMAFQYVSRSAKQLGLGPGATLVDVLKEITNQGLGADEVMEMFTQRSGRAVLVLKNYIPQLENLVAELRDSQGAAENLADVMQSSVYGKFKQFLALIAGVKIEIFENYKTSAGSSLDAINGLIREHNEGLAKLITSLASVAVEVLKLWAAFKGAQIINMSALAIKAMITNAAGGLTVFPLLNDMIIAYQSVAVGAATATEAWAFALNSLMAVFKALIPMLLIYGAFKLGKWVYDAIKEHKQLNEQIDTLNRKWSAMEGLPPIDLASKIASSTGGFKKEIDEIDSLIKKLKAERDDITNSLANSEKIRKITIQIDTNEARKEAVRFAEYLNKAGLVKIQIQNKSELDAYMERIRKISPQEAFRMAKSGELTSGYSQSVGYMKNEDFSLINKGLQNMTQNSTNTTLRLGDLWNLMKKLKADADLGIPGAAENLAEAESKYMDFFNALKAAATGTYEEVRNAAQDATDAQFDSIENLQRVLGLVKALNQKQPGTVDLLKKNNPNLKPGDIPQFNTKALEETIQEQTFKYNATRVLMSLGRNPSGAVLDEGTIKEMVDAQWTAQKNAQDDYINKAKSFDKEYRKLKIEELKDNGKYYEYARQLYAEDLRYFSHNATKKAQIEEMIRLKARDLIEADKEKIKKVRDDQIKQYMENQGQLTEYLDQKYKQDLKNKELTEKKKELLTEEYLAARKNAVIKDQEWEIKYEKESLDSLSRMYSEMPQGRYSSEYYSVQKRMLGNEVKERLFALRQKSKLDKNYYEELALLEKWHAEKLAELHRQEVREHGSFLEEMSVAWYDYYQENIKLSNKFYDFWKQTFERIDSAMSDIFVEGMRGHFDSIKDAWNSLMDDMKTSFLRLLYEIAKKQFLMGFGGGSMTSSSLFNMGNLSSLSSLSSWLGGSGVGSGGTLSPYGGTMVPAELGTGSNILFASPYGEGAVTASGATASGGLGSTGIIGGLYALGSGALSYGTSFLGGSLMQLGATNTGYGLFTSGLGGSAAGFNAGASFGSGVSSLGPYALAGAGGYYGGQYFSQNILGQHGQYAGVGGAGGAMAGMYAGSTFGPVGMAVGALLGALAGSALGGIGPDKYAHAGYRTTNVGEYLSRYDKTPTSELPEGALAFQEMIDSLSDSVSDLPEWMGGKYRSDVADTIREIKDFDVTFWVNRNREATGNMSTSLEELQKVFATGYDNLDSVSQEAMLKMLNITEKDLPDALKKGLDAYTQEVTAYYAQITEEAGSIFAQAISAGLQSTSLNTASQTFANTLATQVSNAIAEALTERLKTTSIYESLMEPFLIGIDTSIEGATSAGFDYRGMVEAFSENLSTTPTAQYNPDSVIALLQRLGGTSTGESNYVWRDVPESNRQTRVNTNPYGLQYYAGMSDATALSQISRLPSNYLSSISTLTGPSQYQQFTQMYENLQAINRTDRTGEVSAEQMWNMLQGPAFSAQYGLTSEDISELETAYATSAFNPDNFSTSMEEYISAFESQLPQTVKMFEQVFSVYDRMDKELNAEQYAKNVTDILQQADQYSGQASGRITAIDQKIAEINTQFDNWEDLIGKYEDSASDKYAQDIAALEAARTEAIQAAQQGTSSSEIIANFTSAISTAFSQSTKSAGFQMFISGMNKSVYDTLLSSIVNAFIASSTYQNALRPISEALETAFSTSMSGGMLDIVSYANTINPLIQQFKDAIIDMEPIFGTVYDLVSNLQSQLVDTAETVDQITTNLISQYASNIGDAFLQATSAEGFSMFTTNVKQGMFDAVSQGIISAFLTSDIYRSVMGPLTSAINEAFTQAMTGGAFNESLFRSLIQSPMAMLNTTLSSLEPMFNSIYGLISYIGSRTIRTSFLVGGTAVEAYASGGLTSGVSIAGEAGSEWIVPTYEPQRSQFLKDVGVDMEILGRSLANGITINNPYIMPEYNESPVDRNYKQITPQSTVVVQNGSQSKAFSKDDLQEIGKAIAQNIVIPEASNGAVAVHIYLDGSDITNKVAHDIVTNAVPSMNEAIRSEARRALSK